MKEALEDPTWVDCAPGDDQPSHSGQGAASETPAGRAVSSSDEQPSVNATTSNGQFCIIHPLSLSNFCDRLAVS